MPRRNDIPRTVLLAVLILSLIPAAKAQVDCVFKTLRVASLHGIVMDPVGDAVPDAIVRLRRDGQSVADVRTNEKGQFAVTGLAGHFELAIEATGFAKAWSPIDIGPDVQGVFRSNELRVMLLVGGGEDCEVFTTSKKEFEKAVRVNRQRFKGSQEKNATQK